MRGHDVVLDALLTGSPEAFVAEARNVAGYVRNKAAVDAAEARARKAAAEPLTVLPFSLHRLYADTGDRNTYEALYFDRRKALADLEISILANRDGDGALSTALNDLLWAICDEYTWALPAHLGLLQRPERITLDLFSCETGLYIAEALHLLYDRIDARVAERCRAELRRRILDSFLAEYPAEWWESGTNNWGAVCAGSIGVAFLYEEKDPDRLAAALRRVLATMDAYLSSFPPDGACLEGVCYWEYGFGFFALFADFAFRFTGGAVDLFDDARARRIAGFPQSVALSPTRTVSFADASRFAMADAAATTILHRHYGSAVCLGPADFANPVASMHGAKPAMRLRLSLWNDPARPADQLPDGACFLASAQWLVVRKAPFAFAALFGDNDVSHNHNDIGSFLLVDGDDEGPMDLGCGEYTCQYFSAERYAILCNGSQGHSVPIVGGHLQKDGGRFRSRDVVFEERDGRVFFSGDIAGAYGLDALVSLRRSFEVDPAARSVKLTDAFAGEPMAVTERFVGYAEAEVRGPGEARFGAFLVNFDPALKASVHTELMAPHERMHEPGYRRKVFILDIEVPAGTPSFSVSFLPVA